MNKHANCHSFSHSNIQMTENDGHIIRIRILVMGQQLPRFYIGNLGLHIVEQRRFHAFYERKRKEQQRKKWKIQWLIENGNITVTQRLDFLFDVVDLWRPMTKNNNNNFQLILSNYSDKR